MASGGPLQDLCDEATCPICLDYFVDPVMIAGCGHNFCRACLSQYWGKEEDEAASCPQCRESVPDRSFTPNRQLTNVVEITKKLRIQEQGRSREVEGVCEQHQEPLKLFCKDHQGLICLVCDKSKEHESHKVVPREEAFQEYKDQIRNKLKFLSTERDKMLAHKADAEKESQALLNHTEAERQKVVAEFRQMRQFLDKQEKRLLAQIGWVEKDIARRRDEHVATLSKELSSLEKMIGEMEEKCQQPAREFLQDIGRILQRSEEKEAFRNPVAFPPELTCKVRDFYDVKALLEGVKKQFPAPTATVTLDPDTAHPELVLSEDGKSVRNGDKCQDLPNNPERFDSWPFVLGCEGFTSGRHFWEVTVGGEGDWAVGVARKSVSRKGDFDLNPEEGIWAVGRWAAKYRALNDPNHPPLSFTQEPQSVRVSLDCAEGQVAFSDAETGAHLHTLSGASCCGETLLPFFYVFGEAHLTLSP